MEETKDNNIESQSSDVGHVLLSGLAFFVLLLIFVGASFEVRNNPEVDIDLKAFLITGCLLLFTGLMFFSGIGSMMKISWAQKLSDYVVAAGLSCLMLLMLVIAFNLIFHRKEGFPDTWRGLLTITLLLWPTTGIWILISAWRSQKKDALFRSPIMASIWPLLIFVQSMPLCLILLLIYLVFVGGGEWIGSFFNHPLIGAWIGFGLLAFLVFLAIRVKSNKDSK